MNTNIFDETDLIDFVESGPVTNTGDLTPVFSRTLFTGLVDASHSTGELSTPPKTATSASNFSNLRLEATLNPAPIDITATIFKVIQRFEYGVFSANSSCFNRNQLDTPDPNCGVATLDDASVISMPGEVLSFTPASSNYVATGSPNWNSAIAAFDTGAFPVVVEVQTDYPAGITFAAFMAAHGNPAVDVSMFSEAEAQITALGICANAGPIEASTALFFFFQNYELEVDWDVVSPGAEIIVGDVQLELTDDSEISPYYIEGDISLEITAGSTPEEIVGDISLAIEVSGYGMEIVGDISLEITVDPRTVWSADASGIYQIVWGKRNDTLYDRDSEDDDDVGTVDVAIPRPVSYTHLTL